MIKFKYAIALFFKRMHYNRILNEYHRLCDAAQSKKKVSKTAQIVLRELRKKKEKLSSEIKSLEKLHSYA